MSNNAAWHHKVPDEAQLQQAIEELASVASNNGTTRTGGPS